ncbi:MAG: disulfide bond formation protein B [Oxalobacteraceae bacterium]
MINRYAKPLILLVAIAGIAMLAVGLYLQLVLDMLPCPLCILQRYAFAATAAIGLITFFLPTAALRAGAALGALASLTGAGIAIRHWWVKAHPTVSCGIDPLETSLNKVFFAEWFPALFQADGLCTTEYDPILGLSIPQWALVWFAIFAVTLALVALRYRHAE